MVEIREYLTKVYQHGTARYKGRKESVLDEYEKLIQSMILEAQQNELEKLDVAVHFMGGIGIGLSEYISKRSMEIDAEQQSLKSQLEDMK